MSKWLEHFTRDLLRYPLLILLGASASGKTEYAKSLFQQPLELKVGSSEIFPAKMVEFKRGTHDALILDDVRNLDFLVTHQEKLQGKYIEFATAQGGRASTRSICLRSLQWSPSTLPRKTGRTCSLTIGSASHRTGLSWSGRQLGLSDFSGATTSESQCVLMMSAEKCLRAAASCVRVAGCF